MIDKDKMREELPDSYYEPAIAKRPLPKESVTSELATLRAGQAAKESSSKELEAAKLHEIVSEYVDNYEFRGDAGDYYPSEQEKMLITDAIFGLLEEDDFKAKLRAKDAATIAKRDELIAKKNAELAAWDCIIDDMQVAVSCINPREDMRRAIEALKATIAKLKEYNDSVHASEAEKKQTVLALQAELTASQEQVKRLRDACLAAESAFVTQVGVDYNCTIHAAATQCREALASTAPAVSPDTKED